MYRATNVKFWFTMLASIVALRSSGRSGNAGSSVQHAWRAGREHRRRWQHMPTAESKGVSTDTALRGKAQSARPVPRVSAVWHHAAWGFAEQQPHADCSGVLRVSEAGGHSPDLGAGLQRVRD